MLKCRIAVYLKSSIKFSKKLILIGLLFNYQFDFKLHFLQFSHKIKVFF